MDRTIENDVIRFWNQAFEMSEEEQEQFIKEFDPENGWKELGRAKPKKQEGSPC